MQASTKTLFTLLFSALCAATAPAQTTTVSPRDRATLEGSTSTSYPLGRHDCRYQQLYTDLGKARVMAGHAYRRDALSSRGTIAAFETTLTIALSTAQTTADKPSSSFANNAGKSPTTVLAATAVRFPQTTRPTTIPAAFAFEVPYKTTWVWPGTGALCLDMTIHGNAVGSTKNKTFSASLDAQQQYTSGRNLQPGYPFGTGCPAPNQSRTASATFEVRHLGKTIDLAIDARYGVPSTSSVKARTAILLSNRDGGVPWPFGTKCTLYGEVSHVLALSGSNGTDGGYKATLRVGAAPPSGFEMFAQALSYDPMGAVALSQGSRLITPPPGAGVTTSRVIAASDRTAATGSISFAAPITRFR